MLIISPDFILFFICWQLRWIRGLYIGLTSCFLLFLVGWKVKRGTRRGRGSYHFGGYFGLGGGGEGKNPMGIQNTNLSCLLTKDWQKCLNPSSERNNFYWTKFFSTQNSESQTYILFSHKLLFLVQLLILLQILVQVQIHQKLNYHWKLNS